MSGLASVGKEVNDILYGKNTTDEKTRQLETILAKEFNVKKTLLQVTKIGLLYQRLILESLTNICRGPNIKKKYFNTCKILNSIQLRNAGPY